MALAAFFLPNHGACQPSKNLAREALDSVVLLKSRDTKGCATGFISSSGTIISAGHVLHTICPQMRCNNLIVRRTSRLGTAANAPVSARIFSVAWVEPMLDLAAINVDPASAWQGYFSESSSAEAGDEIWALSFDGCKELRLLHGKVISKDAQWLVTDLKGQYGSSGSPVFNAEYKIVGVIDEAVSATAAIRARLFGGSFALQAVRGDLLALRLNHIPEADIILRQIAVAEKFHSSTVQKASGSARFYRSIQFIRMVDGLRQRLAMTPHEYSEALLALTSYADNYVGSLALFPWIKPLDPIVFRLKLLGLIYSLEYRGMRDSASKIVSAEKVLKSLPTNIQPEELSDLNSVLTTFERSEFQGVIPMLVRYGIILVLITLATVLAWAWSVAHVWAQFRGSLLKRLFLSLAVGFLFWPISYLLFCLSRYRRINI